MRVLTRINPRAASDPTLSSSRGLAEVGLRSRRWVVDRCLDEVLPGQPASGEHGGQEEVWAAVAPLLETPFASVWALGGHFSGKSFTLFGDDSEESRGLVHRYIESIFSAEATGTVFALLSLIVVEADEAVVDVFAGCTRHSFQGNLATIPSLGARALPVLPRVFCDSMRCKEALRLGLLASSVHRARLLPLSNRSHLVVQLSHFHRDAEDTDSSMKTVTFAEISSLELLPDPSSTNDRLAGGTIRNVSARTLKELVLKGPFLQKSASVLSYFLHDALSYVIHENILLRFLSHLLAGKCNCARLPPVRNLRF